MQQEMQEDVHSDCSEHSWGSADNMDSLLEAPPELRNLVYDSELLIAQLWSELKQRGQQTLPALAKRLATYSEYATVRIGTGSDNPAACMTQLRHNFIICRPLTTTKASCELIVEPNFREQFALGRADAEYDALFATIPQLFVGTWTMLDASIKVVCGYMAEALDRAGLSRPPWRDVVSMLSKWHPENYVDEIYTKGAGARSRSGGLAAGMAGAAGGGSAATAAAAGARRGSAQAPGGAGMAPAAAGMVPAAAAAVTGASVAAVPAPPPSVAVKVFKAGQEMDLGQAELEAQQQQAMLGLSLNAEGVVFPAGGSLLLRPRMQATKKKQVQVVKLDDAPPQNVVIGFQPPARPPPRATGYGAGMVGFAGGFAGNAGYFAPATAPQQYHQQYMHYPQYQQYYQQLAQQQQQYYQQQQAQQQQAQQVQQQMYRQRSCGGSTAISGPSSVVSSLSDEWATALRAERRAATASAAAAARQQQQAAAVVRSKAAAQQQQAQVQAPAAPAATAHQQDAVPAAASTQVAAVASAGVQPPAQQQQQAAGGAAAAGVNGPVLLAPKPTMATVSGGHAILARMQEAASKFKALDQLLPAIRTVRLGRV